MLSAVESVVPLLDRFVVAPPMLLSEALCAKLRPATHWLGEWDECLLDAAEDEALTVGDQPAEAVGATLWRLRLGNQLGLAHLRLWRHGHVVDELCVEVVATKLRGLEQHVQFCESLLAELFAKAARLPFTFHGPVTRPVDEAIEPPTPLFVLHFLTSRGHDLRSALGQMVAEPHRLLTDLEERVPLAQASEVDAEVLLDILRHPEEWAPASGFPLATRLGGRAPRRVWQRLPEETFDTPENRFVKRFIEDVATAAEALAQERWWLQVPPPQRADIAETLAVFTDTERSPVLEEAGAMRRLPTSSQVLLRREGYRQVLELWRLYHLARRPLFGALAEAMAVRNVDVLYEIWGFFELVSRIRDVTGEVPVATIETTDDRGLEWRSRVRFGRAGTLVYNRTGRGWSVPLRPDYLWLTRGRKVALDAKFRLNIDEFEAVPVGATGRSTGLDADEAEMDLAVDLPVAPKRLMPDLVGRAKREDLYKMHTYRDALSLDAAVCVYPGDEDVFYRVGGRGSGAVALDVLLMGDVRGVGALAMGPGRQVS